MRAVARQSDDRYEVGPGTLYDNLQKLLEQGVVEKSPQRSATDDLQESLLPPYPIRSAPVGDRGHKTRRGSS
jgi:hypothetical protein